MSTRQVKLWLTRAKRYHNALQEKEKKKEELKENPALIEKLISWAEDILKDKPALRKAFFNETNFIKALENNEKIVFVCVDRIVSEYITRNFSSKLKEVFKKEVLFESE